jgi:DNA invertase Pin-like site-specific DNA recombinase
MVLGLATHNPSHSSMRRSPAKTRSAVGKWGYRGEENGVAIYARVSTDDKRQTPDNQLLQLRAWCARMGYPVVREYVEHENGGKGTEYRKQLAAMFAGAARREFDLLLVWSLDRFSREGMAATVAHLQPLASHGVAFRSFTEEHLSTENELVRNILLATLSSLAKLEREKISQRRRPACSERAQKERCLDGQNLAMVIGTSSSRRSRPATAGTP